MPSPTSEPESESDTCKYHPQSKRVSTCYECKVDMCERCARFDIINEASVYICPVCDYQQTRMRTAGTCLILVLFIYCGFFVYYLNAKSLDWLLDPWVGTVFLVLIVIPSLLSILRLMLNHRGYLRWKKAVPLTDINWQMELASKPNPLKVWVATFNLLYLIYIIMPFIEYETSGDPFHLTWGLFLLGSFLLLYLPYQLRIYKKYKTSRW